MDQKKAALITGGTIDVHFAKRYLEHLKPDLIIAADKGMEFCAAVCRRPDYIIGDFDSADQAVLSKFRDVPRDVFPSEKNESDTELAISKLIALGSGEIHMLGATGSRTDHLMANIAQLVRIYRSGIKGIIADPHNRLRILGSGQTVIHKKELFGEYVSFAPMAGDVHGFTLKGFRYPVKDITMHMGSESLFLSNVLEEAEGMVSIREGIVLMTEAKD